MDAIETLQRVMKLAEAGMTAKLEEEIVNLHEQILALKEKNLRLLAENENLRQQVDAHTKVNAPRR